MEMRDPQDLRCGHLIPLRWGKATSEEAELSIENKYVAIAAVLGFLLVLWLTDGSLIAAFGVLALVAGIGWAVRRLRH
jgi:hypothetical protein